MKRTSFRLSLKRGLALVCAMFLIGCSTTSSYTTRAYPTVPKPVNGSTDYAAWGTYYTDQFNSLGENVERPPADSPDAQKKAYADAKLNWDQQVSIIKKSEQRQNNEALLYLGVGLGSTLILLLAL